MTEWLNFSGGAWTKVVPAMPGLYPIAARTGAFVGFQRVALVGTELLIHLDGRWQPVAAWLAWWWSQPLPELPEAPLDLPSRVDPFDSTV